MNQKSMIITITIVALIVAGYFVLRPKTESVAPTPTPIVTVTPIPTVTSRPVTTPSNYTMADVAMHKDAQSCWTVVSEGVYDLTSWIYKHPGGTQAILSTCGKDGTKDFTMKHGGQGNPEKELASFRIGTLVK